MNIKQNSYFCEALRLVFDRAEMGVSFLGKLEYCGRTNVSCKLKQLHKIMIDKKSPFFAYRYLVTPISDQISIIHSLNKSKEELMKDIIQDLVINNVKSEWKSGKKRFLFYGSQHKDDIYVVKFARETNEKIYLEGNNDIEIKEINETKFVYIIFDIKHQIILIERNVSIFQDIESSVNILAKFLREKMIKFDYVVNLYPLVSKNKFWTYVDSSEKIYELSIEMNAPNMALFGNADARAVLKQVKQETNNEIFGLSFKSKEGRLRVLREVLGNYIDYVTEVGGKYVIKFMRNGARETKTSETDTVKVNIEQKKTEKFSEEDLLNISDKLILIHTLENRDKGDEYEES